jgi:hypothetical protein
MAVLFLIAPGKAQSIIVSVPGMLNGYLGQIPGGVLTPVTAFLTAVAVISIFFLGLVLELIGSIAVVWEANVFKKHLERHRSWLSDLLANYGSDTVKDADRIVAEFGDPMGEELKDTLRGLAFWRRRKRPRQPSRVIHRFKLLRPISRVQSLLLCYVLAADCAPRFDLLRDHLQLCRTSRAVAGVLYILSFELMIVPAVPLLLELTSGASQAIPHEGGLSVLISMPLAFALAFLAFFLPVKAYQRFCDSLFALVLVVSRNPNNESRGHGGSKA